MDNSHKIRDSYTTISMYSLLTLTTVGYWSDQTKQVCNEYVHTDYIELKLVLYSFYNHFK